MLSLILKLLRHRTTTQGRRVCSRSKIGLALECLEPRRLLSAAALSLRPTNIADEVHTNSSSREAAVYGLPAQSFSSAILKSHDVSRRPTAKDLQEAFVAADLWHIPPQPARADEPDFFRMIRCPDWLDYALFASGPQAFVGEGISRAGFEVFFEISGSGFV